MPEKDEDVVKPVSPVDLEASFSISSPISNRFFVHIGPLGVRLTFAEQVPKTDKFYLRSATTLAFQDAIQLYKVLQRMLEPMESAAAAARAETQASTEEIPKDE